MDDILIRGATVLDGTGGPPQCADVAVRQGRISAFDAGRTETAAREIDATGLMLAPGFIDIHTHSDFTLPLNPMAEAKIRQWVTTEVVGNCGFLSPRLCLEKLNSSPIIFRPARRGCRSPRRISPAIWPPGRQ
jgi:N-acyl-D-aspartate/D-glutamate deacylase